MRSLSIVNFYVLIDTFCELLFSAEKDWTTLFMHNSLRTVLEVYCVPWPLWSIKDCGAFCFDTLAGMLM